MGTLEPAAFFNRVGLIEFRVALGQVDNSFDETDESHYDSSESAGQDGDAEHDDAGGRQSQNELVDSETADEDSADTGGDFLGGKVLWVGHIRRHEQIPSAKRLVEQGGALAT